MAKNRLGNFAKVLKQTFDSMNPPNNASIVFDIDETLIDLDGKRIPEIIDFYNYIKMKGIIPVIITSRPGYPENIRRTQKQLNDCGISDYKLLYFRPPDKTNPYLYKTISRKSVHEKGMIVIMSIGDMIWDIGEFGGKGFIVPRI